jgi:hypothetical protein
MTDERGIVRRSGCTEHLGDRVLLPEYERALSQMRPELQLVDKGDVVSGKTHYKIVEIIPRG